MGEVTQSEAQESKAQAAMREVARWHREPSLYREIYARTVSALIAAFVIYLVAALGGYVSTAPGVGISGAAAIIFFIAGLMMALWTAPRRDKASTSATRRQVFKAGVRARLADDSTHAAPAAVFLMAGVSIALGTVLSILGALRN